MIEKYLTFDLNYIIKNTTIDNHSFLNKYFDDFIPIELYLNKDNYKTVEVTNKNDEIVACNFFVVKGDLVHINATAIDDKYQKMGINQNIKKILINYCKENNIKKITCNVRESNKNSLNSLIHTGFIINYNVDLFYPDGEKKIALYFMV